MRPRESIEWTRRLVNECGVFAGISAGAALAGAAKVAEQIDEGTIVFIVCDGGWKYLSTGAYTDDLDVRRSQRRERSSTSDSPARVGDAAVAIERSTVRIAPRSTCDAGLHERLGDDRPAV